ncbi:MAG: Bug family tripartite tricarboxylate transporter substrate binding protein [Hyphomicrobiaceae bacterium]
MNRSILAAIAGLLVVSPVQAQDVSFEGKTINIIINFPAGGSTDILLRSLVPAIEAHIPGKPKIVVENKPGAGGLVAANYFYNQVKPDGLTIGFLTGIGTSGIVGLPRVKFDPTRMRWLAALPQTQILVARTDLGIKEAKDIATPAKQIVHAITGPNSSATVLTKLFYGMAGVPHKLVAGYRGQADTILALQRGEVNASDMGITIYLAKAKDMKSTMGLSGVLQRGMLKDNGEFVRHRLLPDIPTAVEAIRALAPAKLSSTDFKAYKIVIGTFNVQFGFQLPPKTDEKIVRSLRKAIIAALGSGQAKQAAMKSAGFDYDYIDGAAAEKELALLSAEVKQDPAVKQLLTNLMSAK